MEELRGYDENSFKALLMHTEKSMESIDRETHANSIRMAKVSRQLLINA